MEKKEVKQVIVDSELEGMRLDRYLRKNFKDESLSRIFGAIRAGDVKVNGKKSKENYTHSLVCLAVPISISLAESVKVSVSGLSPAASKSSLYFTM